MRINNNLMAMNTHRQLGMNANAGAKSIEKLSSGYRINRAGDDAAGLAISEKMRAQVRGLNQASRNSQDAISMIQTAEGALNETQAILQRMRELAVQSANDTNVDTDRGALQNEINQLSEEITRIASTTEFNTQSLLDGTLDDIKFQIGANETQELGLNIGDMRADALKVVSDSVTIGDQGDAVTGVEADLTFNLEGVTLTATEGGAVGAELEITSASGVNTDGYADDIEMYYSKGVTNTGAVTFDGANEITFSDDDIKWSSIDTASGNSSLTITQSSGGSVKVEIDVHDSGGNNYVITDYAHADSGGTVTYDNHGINFSISSDDWALMSGAPVSVDFNAISSGADIDFTTSGVDTANNWKVMTLDSGNSAGTFTGGKISLDASSGQWIDGTNQIQISGQGLEAASGKITVVITNADGTQSTDVYTKADAQLTSGVFTYDNHGVSFEININDITDFAIDQAITEKDAVVTASTNADDFKFSIVDDNGATISGITVALDSGTVYSLDEIATKINEAVSGTAGTFGSNVAVVSGDTLKLVSSFAGDDSNVTISEAGKLDSIFTDADKKDGSDSSVNLTLNDASGNRIDSGVINPSDTSIGFEDSNGNDITFEFEGYDTLSGVDVADAFGASSMERSETGLDISSQEAASAAITTLNDAINTVSDERAKLGAVQNRLEHTIKNLDTSAENLQASESRIRDVDMAKEMMEFTKNNILQQAAQSMLAQANQAPQGVLQLLR